MLTGNVMISVTTKAPGGRYQPDNVGAIRIADANTKFVKSLYVWGQQRRGELRQWTSATSAAGLSNNLVDAVTAATMKSHGARTASWNGTDTRKRWSRTARTRSASRCRTGQSAISMRRLHEEPIGADGDALRHHRLHRPQDHLHAMKMKTTTAILLLSLLALSGAACTHVPPFQRGRLAHPTMLLQETAGPGESARLRHPRGRGGRGSRRRRWLWMQLTSASRPDQNTPASVSASRDRDRGRAVDRASRRLGPGLGGMDRSLC